MIDRRTFLRTAVATPLALCVPHLGFAQSSDPKPDFDIAGSAQSDPAGYEIAWSSLWTGVDMDSVSFQPVPGQTGFVVLDSEEREVGQSKFLSKQRLVIETNAVSGPIDPDDLMNSFEDLHPTTHMGYAPGTVIESRHVTDQGCWFSFGPGPNGGGIEGVVGISMYYTPANAGAPLLNARFNIANGSFRTPEFLEEMDSTVSLNGNWLMGMDELGNFWEAIENSYAYPDTVF